MDVNNNEDWNNYFSLGKHLPTYWEVGEL